MNIRKMLSKPIIRVFTIGAMFALPQFANAFSGGNGSASSPYLITTPAELDDVRNIQKGKYFRLTTDLNMQEYISNKYGEEGWLPLTSSGSKAFAGYFHGGRHKIHGLNINRPETSGIGLFAMIGEGALVDSVGVVGIITGKDSVGGVSGSIEQGSHIYACYFQGNITGNARVGGISGFCGNGTELSYSYVAGNITGSYEVGGICGFNYSGALINDCYHVGDVSGDYCVGGVLGYNSNGGRMTSTYHTGKVEGGAAVGGVLGYNYNSIVMGCIFDISNAGVTDAVGYNMYGWTNMVAGKTPAEMTNIYIINSYFDLDNFWAIDTSLSYPFFTWDDNPTYPKINGDGTAKNPFQIYTPAQLDSVRNHPDAEWVLMNDLDLTDYLKDRSFEPIGAFTGYFHGQGYRITGLNIQTTTNNAGLFGNTNGAKIDSLGVEGTVNCPTADYVGGLVGNAQNGTQISNSYFKGNITGNSKVGGIVGCMTNGGQIENVFHLGRVDAVSEAGGIVGTTVSGSDGSSITVQNVFQAGTVNAFSGLGGIVDVITSGASFSNCYYDMGYSPLKAYAESGAGSAVQNVEGKTTAEMVRRETFNNWDFGNIWNIDDDATYPWLRIFPQKEYPKSFTTDGSPQNPYKIYTASQLDSVRNDLDGNYILMNDIDLSDYIAQYYPDSGWLPIGGIGETQQPFTGVFDGQGHKITNLSINYPASNSVGLFAINAGIIKNLGVEGTVTGNTFVGGLCGTLAGETNRITTSYFKGKIIGDTLAGGIVGVNMDGTLQDVYALADVTATGSRAGGIAGATGYNALTVDAFFSGNVQSGDNISGAIVGVNVDDAVINSAYFDSTFSGSSAIGGNGGGDVTYTALATCEATFKSSYDSLDFENTWAIDDSLSYPYLRIFGNPYYPQIGTGTEEDPYQIYTVAQLDSVRYHLDRHYILMADLNLSKYSSWIPIGDTLNPFTGTFNGNGHIIRELNVLDMDSDHTGLFGSVSGATIERLGVYGTVHGGTYVGGITGSAYNNSVLNEVFFDGSVIGTAYVGGIVGDMGLAVVENAYHVGTVYGTASRIGGIAGHADSSTIRQTYHSGHLIGSTRIGGIVGCVLDYSDNGTGTTVANSYFNSQLSDVGCSIGSPNTPAESKTDADFVQKATFGGFDFGDIWGIDAGKSYPFLQALPYPYYPDLRYVLADEDHGGRLPSVFAVT
ncbi:MAG: hypothetical protein LBF01_03785, partial [Bacteroidales bacterium]|nr:hypothetical protein [Bacteroidales bacterium]